MTAVSNPYQQVYKNTVQKVSQTMTMKQAQQMATHMSLMYNAFGYALKDLVSLLSHLYSDRRQLDQTFSMSKNKYNTSPTKEEENQKTNSNSAKIDDNISELSKQLQKDQKEFDFSKYKLNVREEKPNGPTQQKYSLGNKSKTTKTTNNTTKQTKSKPVTRIQVVRGKQQRQALNGYSCTMCEKFYKALGEDYVDKEGKNKLCNDCSRHRSNLPPTNFYTDFSQEFGFDD